MERQIIACIPIPGLNEWAKDVANANQNVEGYVNYLILFTELLTLYYY